jgi:hypothetical protein
MSTKTSKCLQKGRVFGRKTQNITWFHSKRNENDSKDNVWIRKMCYGFRFQKPLASGRALAAMKTPLRKTIIFFLFSYQVSIKTWYSRLEWRDLFNNRWNNREDNCKKISIFEGCIRHKNLRYPSGMKKTFHSQS